MGFSDRRSSVSGGKPLFLTSGPSSLCSLSGPLFFFLLAGPRNAAYLLLLISSIHPLSSLGFFSLQTHSRSGMFLPGYHLSHTLQTNTFVSVLPSITWAKSLLHINNTPEEFTGIYRILQTDEIVVEFSLALSQGVLSLRVWLTHRPLLACSYLAKMHRSILRRSPSSQHRGPDESG